MEKILVIEDEVDLGITISVRLRNEGYQTCVANDAIAALDCLKKNKYDLIILDIMMRVMDGCSLGAILRTREDTRELPIIVLSALRDEETKSVCRDLDVAAYLEKPYDPGKLLGEIKKVFHIS